MENFVLRDVHVYNSTDVTKHAYIIVKDGKIEAVGANDRLENEIPDEERRHLSEYTVEPGTALVPGMIDVHIHGTNNADTMDGTPDALTTIAQSLPSEGTTAFLATTITQTQELITKALKNAADFALNQPGNQAEMLGIHLEGPFFTKEKAGAQPKEYLLEADVPLFKQWQKAADGLIKWVSLAPERDPDHALIRHLKETGVVAAAAHSGATLEEVEKAADSGLSHVTHLFNGMSGLHHREPGLASAALLNKQLTNEMIADGVHVHPAMVNMAYQMKGAAGLLLITDSIRAKCLQNGKYDLGGQTVTVEGNHPYLEDGTIAGSMLKMNQAVKNIMDYTNCRLEEAVAMTSSNAAAKLGLRRKGAIAAGMDADFVLLDENHEVIRTWCRGQIAFER
ncbi:N-acetylglucosamine-6-phosphate deacetylase [Salibacterium salarium]|uniref:N-acetylglucosamine-6-phosphate deacetylase n=1 Tax=Salibacterium salarium TaxID=284579 RepID=A0A3R9P7Q9_9BACI|nr:N-acetylglucosamine-6-phosphate deacetylase [Salibacterium salarium]RSL32175.1 N-acetylglucosamine-6-phosphate deacetylase [Salibacterium salarium]